MPEQLVTLLPHLEAGDSSTSLLAEVDIQQHEARGAGTEDLVIHHGQTWVQDILVSIKVRNG